MQTTTIEYLRKGIAQAKRRAGRAESDWRYQCEVAKAEDLLAQLDALMLSPQSRAPQVRQ